MRRGTRVGQAYVALTVDGDGINDQIVGDFERIDGHQLGRDLKGRMVKGFADSKSRFELFSEIEDQIGEASEKVLGRIRELNKDIEVAVKNDAAISTGLRDEIERSLNNGDLDSLMRSVGFHIGKKWGDGFDHQIKNSVVNSLRTAMEHAARYDVDFDPLTDFRQTVANIPSRQFEKIARSAAESVEQYERAWQQALDENARRDKAHLAEITKAHEEAFAENRARIAEEWRDRARFWKAQEDADRDYMDRIAQQGRAMQVEHDRRLQRERDYQAVWTKLLDERDADLDALADEHRFAALNRQIQQMFDKIKIHPDVDQATLRKTQRKIRDAIERSDEIKLRLSGELPARERDRLEAQLEGLEASIEVDIDRHSYARVQQQLDRLTGRGRGRSLGDRVGRLLGAGSRNNFLNVFGRSLGGLVKIMSSVTRGAFGMFSTFRTGFNSLGTAAKMTEKLRAGFSAVGGSLGNAMKSLGRSLPGIIGAVAVVTIGLSAMASIAGALIGIVTALAATIAGALAGALAVTGGLLLSVVTAAGLLTAAFMSMTDAQKRTLKEAFIPLREQMVGLGQLMLQHMVPVFSIWSENLQRALHLITPMVDRLGYAFAQAGVNLTSSFAGPGFQAFSTAMTTYLPNIVNNLTLAFGNFMNGLMGMFAAITPAVQRFSTYLSEVTLRFNNWATSAAGQNSISNFVDRALESLQSLWNFTREFFGFFFDVLFSPQAMSAGNTIFDSMANKFHQFREAVERAAANGDLQRWFDDAVEFGSQLWAVMEALGHTFIVLYDSGVIEAIGGALEKLAGAMEWTADKAGLLDKYLGGPFRAAMSSITPAFGTMGLAARIAASDIGASGNSAQGSASQFESVAERIRRAAERAAAGANALRAHSNYAQRNQYNLSMLDAAPRLPSIPTVQGIGRDALAQTTHGGGRRRGPKQFKNPWKKWAESLINEGPGIIEEVRKALNDTYRGIVQALTEAASADSPEALVSGLTSMTSSVRDAATRAVEQARNELNSAARSLASASNMADARKALAEVKEAQRGLKVALADQRRIMVWVHRLNRQRVSQENRIEALASGRQATYATLADYAEARARVAERLAEADQKLAQAMQTRDNYMSQVENSLKSFGSLMTTQARVFNGVEQEITSRDVTKNLWNRLKQIRTFQSNLRLLLAQGLSNDVYKQLVDAGVEEGGAMAEALLAGGVGSIQQVNSLTDKINSASESLGKTAGNRLYQAGVDAAQGLVDGLTSLSAELDSAAAALGESIASAIRRSLGIQSPSKVLYQMMDNVGDGIVGGLGAQGAKVGTAASALANRIAVSPSGAYFGSGAGSDGSVSGNKDQRPIDLTVVTPTEDPHAVAHEVLNEMMGRL